MQKGRGRTAESKDENCLEVLNQEEQEIFFTRSGCVMHNGATRRKDVAVPR
jgi:hypothetical protein